jgi:peptidyl-prolyl cis-trans isomerase C
MTHYFRNSVVIFLFVGLIVLVASGYSEQPKAVVSSPVAGAAPELRDDVIARVGDQDISYGQINTMMNSSAVVGLSLPALGTAQRDKVRIMLLDKVISANLLYLDALKRGVDQDPVYQEALQRFSDGMLAALYRSKQLAADIRVGEDEVRAFQARSMVPDAELTDAARTVIEASLRKQKLDERDANLRTQLREGITIHVDEKHLDPARDAAHQAADVIARVGDHAITWAEAKAILLTASRRSELSAGHLDPVAERLKALDRVIDTRIMADMGRAAGLEQDPVYQARYQEYRKTRLINHYRGKLLAGWEPDKAAIDAYYARHQARISVPEERKLQMVVLEDREAASRLKGRIEAGEMTLYEAARDHSIDPNAQQHLGEMGWVRQGTGFAELDAVTFSLGPGEIGGPVESPAGWHLVKVLDIREAQFQDIADDNTRTVTRRTLMREQLNNYVVALRKNDFEVTVYEDRLKELSRAEAEWIAGLEEKARETTSLSKQREAGFRQLMSQ